MSCLYSAAHRVVIGLTETSFRTNEGGIVSVCMQWIQGETSHPVEVRVQTGHVSDITGSESTAKASWTRIAPRQLCSSFSILCHPLQETPPLGKT